MASLRERILAHNDIKLEPVVIPERSETVWVKTLSSADALKIKNSASSDSAAVLTTVLVGACDEHGQRLFTEVDLEILSEKSFIVLDRIALAVITNNGMNKDAHDEAKK